MPLPNLRELVRVIRFQKGGRNSYLPHPVFFPQRLRSYDVFTMQQREQVDEPQKVVLPLSPKLHSRRVPCHRRFSFPAERP